MKASLLLILAAVAVGGAGTAYAQADSGGGSDAGTATAPPGGPEAGSAAAAAPGGWLALDSRPMTVPKGKLAVDGLLPLLGVSDGSGGTQFGAALQVSGTYGVLDNLEVGADFSLDLAPSFDAGVLGVRGAYTIFHNDKMDFAAAGEFLFGLSGGNDVALDIGAWFRYRIAPKM